ncbi:MAG: Asp-tRNA(Asn)/Glu-tRNA(Gln) amidotransferase subunit GatA [Ignavibacteria bacterium]|nr:Asp-tRNA(Asn)/Glu-tRNA(Gln) amidotransferase subunit GatA [Ignavibacteria bacterium]
MKFSYRELRKKLDSGETSCREVVSSYLNKINERKHLNVFLSVFNEEALKKADEIDYKIKSGYAGRLAGMVISIKDVLSLKGKKMTCASKMLENFEAVYTATAVQRLIDEDVIIIGKTNCDEFAMGSSNENSAFGAVLNPADESRVAGGSSGGSAAAVAAEMCMISLGTDTGGSIRQPAAFCGVIGLKPTYGRVSRYGLTAFASSFDTIGPLGKDIYDIALVLEIMSGYDPRDSTSVSDVTDFKAEDIENIDLNNLRIGVVKEYLGEGLQPEIRDKIKEVIERLRDSGLIIKEVSLPYLKYSIQTYYILTTAEASSNLARYDGARYGYRSPDSGDVETMYINSRSEGFGEEVKRRIMLGTYVLSAGYYDAYYRKAQKVRRLIKNDFIKAFEEVDLLLTPSTPTTAFRIGEKTTDPLEMYLNDIFTTSANLAGNPAISIPVGWDKEKLPIGIQLTARDFDEKTALAAADYILRSEFT